MRNLSRCVIVLLVCAAPAVGQAGHGDVRATVGQFEQGLRDRKLALIEPVVADDIVVFENGERNDGWADFRDNHLKPELAEPAHPSTTSLVRMKVSGNMAWAYSETIVPRSGKPDAVVWSSYVLERRKGAWKIVSLNWSIGTRSKQ